MMEHIFMRFVEAFSVEFIFTIILASYFAIRALEWLNGNMAISSWVKKLATVVVGIVTFWEFVALTSVPKETLLSSYFAALFIYDYAIKWLLKKFNVNYKK